MEALSLTNWTMTALIAFLRRDDFVPSDRLIVNRLVRSVSMGIAHQANIASSCMSFLGKKHRDLFLSHLPLFYFLDLQKEVL